MKKDNTYIVLLQLIRKLKIQLSETEIFNELEKHPEYPRLKSLSDVLDNFRVPNMAYKLEFDELLSIEIPFIAHLETPKGKREFVLILEIDNEGVYLSNENYKNHYLAKEEFKELFTGIVLIAEPADNTKESSIFLKKAKNIVAANRNFLIGISLFITIILLLSFHDRGISCYSTPVFYLVILKMIGMGICLILMVQSMDANNSLVNRLCNLSKTNCNMVLSSEHARLFGIISWTDLGALYFVGTFSASILSYWSPPIILVLRFFNYLTIPYAFYSIYTQYKTLKNWCVLCCLIQLVFIVEFIIFYFIPSSGIELPNARELIDLYCCFAVPCLLWIFSKRYFLRLIHLESLRAELRKLKYNTSIFNSILSQQPQYRLLSENDSIIIGNSSAKTTVTLIASPYCEPCAAAHRSLDSWIHDRNDIRFQIIFTTADDHQNHKTDLSFHFMSLRSGNDLAYLRKALNDWYGQKKKDYKKWANSYPILNGPIRDSTIEIQREWCKMVDIDSTPALFINGYKVPDSFQPGDIKYLV